MAYRCVATSVAGFVQQLAVSYIANGYWFYVTGRIPEHKDATAVDRKIVRPYAIDVSKWTRARRNQNNGAGWLLPATLRLAEYGLGHAERAREPQPVAARLGERFYPWQLEGTVAESWEECRRHAENLRRIRAGGAPAPAPAALHDAPPGGGTPTAPATDLLGARIATDLFGKELQNRPRRRR